MFGAISSNREGIIVFIAMLKSLRFTFDHEELVSNQQDINVVTVQLPARIICIFGDICNYNLII